MFQLQHLTHSKHMQWLVKTMFIVVIVSFIFFYGWNSASNRRDQEQSSFARMRSESWNPLQRWDYLTVDELAMGKREARSAKLAELPEGVASYLDKVGITDRLVNDEDAARQAADDVVLQRLAHNVGIHVTMDQIIQMIKSQPNMSNDMLAQAAAAQGFGQNVGGFLEDLRAQMEMHAAQNVVALVAQASLYEVWQEYLLAKESFVLQVAGYPQSDFAARVVVNDADLEKYLGDHRKDFHKPAQRRYDYVALHASDLESSIKPTEDQIKAYYAKNQAKYHHKAGVRAEQIQVVADNNAPTTASMVAALRFKDQIDKDKTWVLLTDKLTSETKSQVSFYYRSAAWLDNDSTAYSKQYMNEMARMAVDTVSTPTQENNGVFFARVLERRTDGVPPLSEIHDLVTIDTKMDLALQRVDEIAARMTNAIEGSKKPGAAPLHLHELAQSLKVEDHLTSYVATTATNIPGLGDLSQDKDYLSILNPREVSDVIKRQGSIAVLEVMDETPAADPPLKDVRQEVEAAYRAQEAIKLAKDAAEQSLKLVQGGADFNKALETAPLKPTLTDPLTRDQQVTALKAPLINFAQQTVNLASGAKGICAYGAKPEAPDGYAVWQVVTMEQPTREQFATDRNSFEQQYLQVQRLTILKEWLKDQRQLAQFTILEHGQQ